MNIINIIDINRLCQINMYKILQKYNKQTRVCKINLKDTKNGKVVKEYNFLCKSHTTLQNEEQTKSANNRYIYLNNSGIQVLDIDKYDGLNYIYNLIKTEIYDYNYNVSSNEYVSYINGKQEKVIITENILKNTVNNIINQVSITEHTLINVIGYACIFNSILNCPIDLTCNGLLHLYFLSDINQNESRKSVNNIELLSKGCICISNGLYYKLVYHNDIIPLCPDNIINIFKKNNIDHIHSSEDIKYYHGFNNKIDKNVFIREIENILINILPIEYIDDYNTWYKLTICCRNIINKMGIQYENKIFNIFDNMSKRSCKYNKEQNIVYWNSANNYNISEKYIYSLLCKCGLLSVKSGDIDKEINELLGIYVFKYSSSIGKLIYREEGSHYQEISDVEMSKIYYKLFNITLSNMKLYIQNLIYNIIARVEHIDVAISDYTNIIPFTDFIFDLKIRDIRSYTNEDYILYDVGYNFPIDVYKKSLENYNNFISESICLKTINDMFILEDEHNYFWQCMSENLDRKNKYDSILFMYGPKSNGKSSIFRLNNLAFGKLNVPVGSSFLQGRSKKSGEPEYYRMLFAFYASIADNCTKIDSEVIKTISTGDKISFRMLYVNNFIEFTPSFSIIINSNFLPQFTQYDGGVKRRIRIIPFRVCFTQHPKLSHEKFANILLKNDFSENIYWRNDYIINLIHCYYKKRFDFICKDIIKQIDMLNERFLGYLFERYTIDNEINDNISFDIFYNEYREYMITNESIKQLVKKEKVLEIFNSFDISYNPILNVICNLKQIV